MTHAELRLMTPFWREVASGPVRSTALQAAAFLRRFAVARRPLQGRDLAKVAIRLSRKAGRAVLVGKVRPEVVKRAGGFCECECGRSISDGFPEWHPCRAEWDEFYGRAPKDITVEKTWLLAKYCHGQKGRNDPSRAHWDALFEKHCRKHGYSFRPRLTKHLARRSQASEPDERMERSRGGLTGISTGGNHG